MTIHQEPETTREAAPAVEGKPCRRCGTTLADDQRYCLNCGQRRAEARLAFLEVLEQKYRRQSAAGAAAPPAAPATARWQPTPGFAGGALALLGLALALGVLIGSAGDDSPKQVAAAPPQVITVAGAGAAAPAAEFQSDWPDGQDGFTVQLQTLPKDGTDVAAVQSAKTAAQSKGATDVGALDADDFSSLDAGNYVIYAGVFDTRKQAKKALSRLKSDFPGAKIVQVGAGGDLAASGDAGALSGKKKEATVGKNQLKGLQKLSPDEYQKKAKKLPDTTKLPGKAPKKDNKKPGGGSQGDVIE
jgi:hypothetical protein